jgi:hypothetical protein
MMMKTLLALCLTVGLAFSAWGHVPAGQQYLAFQFPAGSEPTLDGDLSEWANVPQDYWIGPEHHVGGDGSQWTDLSDMNSKIIIGYSASTDRIYFHHEYFDDFRIRDFADLPPISGLFGDVPKLPDTFEIQVDADHGGEDHWFDAQEDGSSSEDGSRWAQNTHYRYPDLDPGVANTNVEQTAWAWQWYSLATWTGNQPWSALGYTSDAVELNASDVNAQVEIMFTAWDNLQWNDPDGSVVHDMVEGQTIGMNWQISDYDALDDNASENWYLSGDTTMWLTSSTATDFLLAPLEDTMTGVEAESWGRVKAAFTQ